MYENEDYVAAEWVNKYGATIRITYSKHIHAPEYWSQGYRTWTMNKHGRLSHFLGLTETTQKSLSINLPYHIWRDYQ